MSMLGRIFRLLYEKSSQVCNKFGIFDPLFAYEMVDYTWKFNHPSMVVLSTILRKDKKRANNTKVKLNMTVQAVQL